MPADSSIERHEFLLRQLRVTGRIVSAEVAASLEVTPETVRKDLAGLEARGLLRRIHGGAVPVGASSVEPDVAARTEFALEKRRIAQAALAYLPYSGSVLFDAGSTIAELAALVPADRELTVFTNAIPIALTLITKPKLTVHLLGGRMRGPTLATVGSWATRNLDDLTVDVAFLGTNAVSLDQGLTTPDVTEAEIKQLMTSHARQRILLADRSKFGTSSLVRHARLEDLDVVITDDGIAPELASAIIDRGPELRRV